MNATDLPIDGQKTRRRAAMYVRMSTDHQKYSTENQADAIQEYALEITSILSALMPMPVKAA